MNKFVTAALSGAIFAGSIVAAMSGEVQGVVASVDAATRTITLEDGTAYLAAEGVDLTAIAAGDHVKITFDDGTTSATAVEKEAM